MSDSLTYTRSYVAGQDLTDRLYYPVALGTDGRLVIPRRGHAVVGILYDKAQAGSQAAVATEGECQVVLGANVARMEYLAVGFDGRAVEARSGDNVIGLALERGGAGQVIRMKTAISTAVGSGGGGGGTGLANIEDSTEGVEVTGGNEGRITAEQLRILSNPQGNDGINLVGFSGQINDYSIRFPVNPFAEGEYIRVGALANGVVDLDSADLTLSALSDVSDAVPVDGNTIVRRGSTWVYEALPTSTGPQTDLYPNLTNETFGVSVDSQLRARRVQIVDDRDAGVILLTHDAHTETYGLRFPQTAPNLGRFLQVGSSSNIDGLQTQNIVGATIEANTLTDVTIESPADNHALIYDASQSGWLNRIPTRLQSPGGHAQVFVEDYLDGGLAFFGDDSGYGLRVLGETAALQTGVMATDYRFSVSASGFYLAAGDEGLQAQSRTTLDLGRMSDGLIVQSGTTADRPVVPAGQSITRFNTDTGHVEVGRVVAGAQDWLSITASGSASGSRFQPPSLWTDFFSQVSIDHTTISGWRERGGADTTGVNRIFLAYAGEDRTDPDLPPNNFTDLAGSWTPPVIPANRARYYEDANSESNYSYPGFNTFFFGGGEDWNLTGVNEVPLNTLTGNDLLIAFSIRRPYPFNGLETDTPILEVGAGDQPYGSFATPLIGYQASNLGLYVNWGTGEGGTPQSETHRQYLTTSPGDGNIGQSGEQTTAGNVLIATPDDTTSGAFTFRIEITTFVDGNDAGTASHTFAVGNVRAGQTFSDINIERENTDAEVEYLPSVGSFPNGALRVRLTETTTGIRHRIRAYREVTTTWNLAESFTRVGVSPGQSGGAQPAQYGVNMRHDTHVIAYLYPTLEGTTAADPQMSVRVVAFDVDTHEHRSVNLDLGRRRSQILSGNVIRFADPNFVYRAVQTYSIERSRRLGDADLLAMATAFDSGLGLYTNTDADLVQVQIDGLETSGGGGGGEVSLETTALTGEDADPFYVHLGTGDLNGTASGLVAVQPLDDNFATRGPRSTNIGNINIGAVADPTLVRLVFDDSLIDTNLPEGASINGAGDIVLPAGHWIICASAALTPVRSGDFDTSDRVWATLAIRDRGGERHSQYIYIRNSNDSAEVRRLISSKSSVTGAVISDGSTPIGITLAMATQDTMVNLSIRGAHIHAYRQLTTARIVGS